MDHAAFDDVPNDAYDDLHADRRVLTETLSADGLALARYELAPGDRLSGAVHTHLEQEEVFVVLTGAVTFEVGRDADSAESVTVTADEAVRFAPGEFQSGFVSVDADEHAVVLALGAPRESGETRVSRIPVFDHDVSCPDCGRGDLRFAREDDETDDDLVCPDCGGSTTPDQ
ncbi:cupin domain-containing protein [Halorubrum gandharaense]